MSERNQMLVRCLRLAKRLEGRRYLPAWSVLALELGVCTRTVRRYVSALEEAHWPVPASRPACDLVNDDANPRGVIRAHIPSGVHRRHA